MVAVTNYTVSAEWTGRWWVLQAVEAPGAISQVKRLSQANEIREAVAFVTGEKEDAIEIEVQPVMPTAAASELADADKARELSRHYNAVSAAKSRSAVLALKAAGLALDDIGAVLHISKQRVSQLLRSASESSAA